MANKAVRHQEAYELAGMKDRYKTIEFLRSPLRLQLEIKKDPRDYMGLRVRQIHSFRRPWALQYLHQSPQGGLEDLQMSIHLQPEIKEYPRDCPSSNT
jgi:hypothetical protein